MSSKRLITLLPFLVIIVIVLSVLVFYLISDRTETQSSRNCGSQVFIDSGLGIRTEYNDCLVSFRINTELSNESILDEENEAFGPLIEQYELIFDTLTDVLTVEKILIPAESNIRSLDLDQFEYELISNEIIRYREVESNRYVYGEFYECDTLQQFSRVSRRNSNVCASTFMNNFGSQFPSKITARIADQATLSIFDSIVLMN